MSQLQNMSEEEELRKTHPWRFEVPKEIQTYTLSMVIAYMDDLAHYDMGHAETNVIVPNLKVNGTVEWLPSFFDDDPPQDQPGDENDKTMFAKHTKFNGDVDLLEHLANLDKAAQVHNTFAYHYLIYLVTSDQGQDEVDRELDPNGQLYLPHRDPSLSLAGMKAAEAMGHRFAELELPLMNFVHVGTERKLYQTFRFFMTALASQKKDEPMEKLKYFARCDEMLRRRIMPSLESFRLEDEEFNAIIGLPNGPGYSLTTLQPTDGVDDFDMGESYSRWAVYSTHPLRDVGSDMFDNYEARQEEGDESVARRAHISLCLMINRLISLKKNIGALVLDPEVATQLIKGLSKDGKARTVGRSTIVPMIIKVSNPLPAIADMSLN